MLKIENLALPNIKSISLELTSPGLYGLVGENGIGKSTLFGVINREILANYDELEMDKVVYFPTTDIFDLNLSADAYFSLLSLAERKKAKQLLISMQAGKLGRQKLRKYSLGMLELFTIILAFSIDSDVVIIDELNSGLDTIHNQLFFELLLHEKLSKIILFASHQIDEIEKYCDKNFYLSKEGLTVLKDFSSV